VNCSERDQLDKEVAQVTLEWTALDQTPMPDVSTPGGLKEAEDLTRRRGGARERLGRALTAYQDIAERIAARINCARGLPRLAIRRAIAKLRQQRAGRKWQSGP